MKILLSLILTLITFTAAGADTMTLREKVGQLFVIRPDHLDTTLTNEQIDNNNKYGVKNVSPLMLSLIHI